LLTIIVSSILLSLTLVAHLSSLYFMLTTQVPRLYRLLNVTANPIFNGINHRKKKKSTKKATKKVTTMNTAFTTINIQNHRTSTNILSIVFVVLMHDNFLSLMQLFSFLKIRVKNTFLEGLTWRYWQTSSNTFIKAVQE